MRPVLLDKIASVTLNCGLRHEVRVSDEYPCRAGDLVAVRLLTSKSNYNALELTTGRMSTLKEGDVIVGALGHRNAVQGYAGQVPAKLATGDTINLLNLGGVLGECHSYSPLVGPPHQCEVLGQVLSFPRLNDRSGVPANIGANCGVLDSHLEASAPIVAVVGTSMNSGKTEACLTLIQRFVRQGLKVAGGKTTGVSLRRDVLAMQDSGAQKISIFTDFGVVTTSKETAAPLAKSILNRLNEPRPDVIVLELGDGLLGAYGVQAILADPEIAKALSTIVVAASDPVGAWGAVQLLRTIYQLQPDVITGPATDNEAGVSVIEQETKVPGINARQNAAALASALLDKVMATHA